MARFSLADNGSFYGFELAGNAGSEGKSDLNTHLTNSNLPQLLTSSCCGLFHRFSKTGE